MKYLFTILALIFSYSLFSQNNERNKSQGINSGVLMTGGLMAANANYQLNLKRHAFSFGALMKAFTMIDHPLSGSLSSDAPFVGLNAAYWFFPNKYQQRVDVFFHYHTQFILQNSEMKLDLGKNSNKYFNHLFGYGLNVYLDKKKRVYLYHCLGLGLGMVWWIGQDWDRKLNQYVERKYFFNDLIAMISLGAGFNFKFKKLKTNENQ